MNGQEMNRQRRILWDQQSGACFLCRQAMPEPDSHDHHFGWEHLIPTIDHVVPLSRGGSNQLYNKVLVHAKCNVEKGSSEPTPEILSQLLLFKASLVRGNFIAQAAIHIALAKPSGPYCRLEEYGYPIHDN